MPHANTALRESSPGASHQTASKDQKQPNADYQCLYSQELLCSWSQERPAQHLQLQVFHHNNKAGLAKSNAFLAVSQSTPPQRSTARLGTGSAAGKALPAPDPLS
jgi:hypothetical protein